MICGKQMAHENSLSCYIKGLRIVKLFFDYLFLLCFLLLQQVAPGSMTVLALMGKADVINEVTGALNLL